MAQSTRTGHAGEKPQASFARLVRHKVTAGAVLVLCALLCAAIAAQFVMRAYIGENTRRIEAFALRLAELESRKTISGAELDLLRRQHEARLAAVEDATLIQENNTVSAGDIERLVAQLQEVRTDMAGIDTRNAGLAQDYAGLAQDYSRLRAQLAELAGAGRRADDSADDAQQSADRGRIAENSQLLQDLRKRITRLQTLALALQTRGENQRRQLDEALSERPRTQLAAIVALDALRRATAGGQGFGPELALLEQVWPESRPLTSRLAPLATGQIATAAGLARQTPQILRAMNAALYLPENEGILARLQGTLRSLVSIRDMSEGDLSDPQSIFGAIELRMERADLEEALRIYRMLPQRAQNAGQDWARAIQDRITLEQTLDALAGQLLTDAAIPSADASGRAPEQGAEETVILPEPRGMP